MSYLVVDNVNIVGITTCVPKNIEDNINLPFYNKDEAIRVIESTGIKRKRIVDKDVTSGDLCSQSAEDLINNIGWGKDEIDCLIFVSQTPDYILPATSCIIQRKLGLSNRCCCFDISYGCSGWVYGLSVIASLISSGTMKKGLLLVGDTTSSFKSIKDKTSRPLFGDAGTATAVEFNKNASPMYFALYANGDKYESIIVRDGGCRNPFSISSLKEEKYENGAIRTRLHSEMDGLDIFSFAITEAPSVTNDIVKYSGHTLDNVDYFIFHQANKFLNEKIRKKLNIPPFKVPYSLSEFGNVSCATIPLTIDFFFKHANELNNKLIVSTAFGVGLSWGSVLFRFKNLKYLSLTEYEKHI